MPILTCELCNLDKPDVADRHGFLACAACVRGKTWEQLDAQRVLMRRKKSRGEKRRERVKKLAEKHGVIDRYGDAIE